MLLLATTNPGKLREMDAILAPIGTILRSLLDFTGIPAPDEDADTFEGNAIKKARYYAEATGMIVVADDSGLEVDALGGLPGVRSARFAGPNADSRQNNFRLIQALKDVPLDRRAARFRCVIAVADSTRLIGTAAGRIDGVIIDEPRGSGGFGYDPHFFFPEFGMTMAELALERKNQISHRARALQAVLGLLIDQFKKA